MDASLRGGFIAVAVRGSLLNLSADHFFQLVGWVEVRNPTIRTLPRGVHFLCLSKENEPKEKTPDTLACGATALRFLSGKLTKLAALRQVSF